MSIRAKWCRPAPTRRDPRMGWCERRWLRACVAVGLVLGVWNIGPASARGQAPAENPPAVVPVAPQNPPAGVPVAPQNPQPMPPTGPGTPGGTQLPPPRPLDPPPIMMVKPCPPPVPVLGSPPRITENTQQKFGQFIDNPIDPEMTLDLIQGRTRLLPLKQVPKRIQVTDDSILDYNPLEPNQLALLGRNVGITVLTFTFVDPQDKTKEVILGYYVRVLPDPEWKRRLEQAYSDLETQINRTFHDSHVCLRLVGDKLVISGHVKDIFDANQILRLVRANAPAPTRDGMGGHSQASRIPVDRQAAGKDPNETAGGKQLPWSPGLENYLVDGPAWLVNLLRIPGEQQVNLKVTLAEVNRAAARSIGLNFTLINNAGMPYFANATGDITTGALAPSLGFGLGGFGLGGGAAGANGIVPQTPGIAPGAGGFVNLPFNLDNGQVRIAFSALKALHYAKFLAEPNLTTMNGQTATFDAGGSFPVPIISSGGGGYSGYGLQGVTFVPYGVHLEFTPYITDRDRIRLQIGAQITARDLSAGTSNFGGTNVPSLSNRSVATTVELREGQTLAIAGLIQNNAGADSRRIPFLGDLPYVGQFTGFSRVEAGEQELVMIITPELVHPFNGKEAMLPLPGADLFEPSDVEFYVKGRIESRRPYDYRSPIMTDAQRMKQYRRMEQTFIAGPSGFSEPVPGPNQ